MEGFFFAGNMINAKYILKTFCKKKPLNIKKLTATIYQPIQTSANQPAITQPQFSTMSKGIINGWDYENLHSGQAKAISYVIEEILDEVGWYDDDSNYLMCDEAADKIRDGIKYKRSVVIVEGCHNGGSMSFKGGGSIGGVYHGYFVNVYVF